MRIRLGTRGSQLALWQANWVATQLRELSNAVVEIVEIRTEGDRRHDTISGLGAPGVFTKEIQQALLSGEADLAVHSLKDLPTEVVPGLHLAAVPRREATADSLLSRSGRGFHDLPKGSIIGTGSTRRRAQLLHARPDLVMADIRGNVDTRMRKLQEGQYDALLLAQAGLNRLGFAEHITEVLSHDLVLPAVGQGALGLETRADDAATIKAIALLNDAATHTAVLAERALLAALRGGCLAPVGALAQCSPRGELHLSAVVLRPDGSERLIAAAAVDSKFQHPLAVQLGERVAEDLLRQGAATLIDAARRTAG